MTTATAKKTHTVKRVLTAKDVMEKRIITLSRTAPLSEAERVLTENRISGMPVTDVAGRAIGVISYRDLLDHYAENPEARPARARAFYRLSTEQLLDEDFESFEVPEESEDTVEDVMTPEVIHVPTDATLPQVCRTMAKHSVHRVLVTDPKSQKVVGIICSMGLIAAMGS
jgi:CBS domain-containing protein